MLFKNELQCFPFKTRLVLLFGTVFQMRDGTIAIWAQFVSEKLELYLCCICWWPLRIFTIKFSLPLPSLTLTSFRIQLLPASYCPQKNATRWQNFTSSISWVLFKKLCSSDIYIYFFLIGWAALCFLLLMCLCFLLLLHSGNGFNRQM